MIENWLPVVGYEGYYEVSDFGNVRSVRYDNHGEIVYSKLLKPAVKPRGYLGVVLSKQNITSNKLVHRLVASSFIQNPTHLPEVNHIDGDKTNNAVSNLEWVNGSENLYHAYQNGLKFKHGKSVICIETGEVFDSVKSANERFGVTHYHIADVCNRRGQHKTACGYHWEWVE